MYAGNQISRGYIHMEKNTREGLGMKVSVHSGDFMR